MANADIYSERPKGWDGRAVPEFSSIWTERSRVAATLIEPGWSVLDLGCGEGLIRKFLPAGCRWRGYDLNPPTSDVQKIDLDAGEFPEGRFDVVMLMGVLGWLKKPESVMMRARKATSRILTNDSQRIWSCRRPLNFPTQTGLEKLLVQTDWDCDTKLQWKRDRKRTFYVCRLT